MKIEPRTLLFKKELKLEVLPELQALFSLNKTPTILTIIELPAKPPNEVIKEKRP